MRIRSALLASCAIAFGVAACDDNNTTTPVPLNAHVRFANAISDLSAVNFGANGPTLAQNVAFQSGSATCASLAPGLTVFTFTQTGNTTSLGSFSSTLMADGNYTVVASGTAASPRFALLDNSFTNGTSANGLVRVINAVPNSGMVDLFVTAPNAQLGPASSTGLVYGTGSGFISVPPGPTQAVFTNSGSVTPIFTSSAFNVTAGSNQTGFVTPGTNGQQFGFFLVSNC